MWPAPAAGPRTGRRIATCCPPRPASSTPAASASWPTPRVARPAPSSPPRSTAWRASSTAAPSPPTPGPPTAPGLLAPIPPAIFGEGHGVAVLFVRGDDPRPAVEAALAAEGLSARRLARAADRRRGPRRAGPRHRPRIVQAVVLGGDAGRDSDAERRAYRLRRRIEAGDRRHLRGVVLVPHRRLQGPGRRRRPGRLLPRPGRRAVRGAVRHLPPALLHQHAAHLGAGPAVPHAVPQRRDQRHLGQREPHAGPGRARHRGGRPRPRGAVPPVLRPDDSDSGKLDAAVELLMRGGRDVRHAMAMLMPEAWENVRDLDPEVRGFYRYHSALMEPWDGPAGVVFTDGVGVGAAPRPQRPAPPALPGLRGRLRGRVLRGRRRRRQRATAASSGAGSARARCSSSTPPAASSTTTRARSASPPARRTPAGPPTASTGSTRASPSLETPDDLDRPPGHARLHEGGAGHGAQAHGRRRQGAHLLHGRRLAAAQPGRPPPAAGTTTCASASPRSPTRPSTPCASGWS